MKWSSPHISTKESEMQHLDAVSKTQGWSCFIKRQNIHITSIQVYAPTTDAEKAELDWFYE